MEGFGIHTFRFINAQGKGRFVKFHWRPTIGSASLLWDEAQKLAGKDSDFHRRDLWEAIAMGAFPEYELGLQIVEEAEADDFDFDLLDPTKIIPEELVPVQRMGKLVLHRNPDNFFAETEQAAFCVQNVVPGIDFTDDPLMQVRLFSYLDTQITRLGGPNFAQIPINRPLVPQTNHQKDGFHEHQISKGRAYYSPNTLGGGCPALARGGPMHFPERVAGAKRRVRSETFGDHFTQATMFWNSMAPYEKEHIVQAAVFELGKCESKEIRERMVERFTRVHTDFGAAVGLGLGITGKAGIGQVAAQAARTVAHKLSAKKTVDKSAALSMEGTVKTSIATRKVAILADSGVSATEVGAVRSALRASGAEAHVIASKLGTIETSEGGELEVDQATVHVASVLYDAVYVPGGMKSVAAMKLLGDPIHFLEEAFRHHKPIGATNEGVELLEASRMKGVAVAAPSSAGQTILDAGVVTSRGATNMATFVQTFIEAIAKHRHWDRAEKDSVPA